MPRSSTSWDNLNDIEGLDGKNKEVLRDQLKESTEIIVKEFYHLHSKFFMTVEQKFTVESIKTHLMVLKAYNDGSEEQQSLFQDQMDKLKRVSTMSAIFDILEEFWSFINYDLIELLIDLLGSDDDKKRLKSYKEKFAEYAKRRLYKCPSKVAASIASQCDVYVKVESRFEKSSLHELSRFCKNLSNLLGIKRYAIRLCCIEKGCIRLTFQIHNFVRERIFPISPQQKGMLTKLGIIQLTCGTAHYEFPEVSMICTVMLS